jgi:hypothetical protein
MQSLTIQQVKQKLKTLNDETLSNMLNQRKGNNSELTAAIKNEMIVRTTKEYILKHGQDLSINKKHLDKKLEIIIG